MVMSFGSVLADELDNKRGIAWLTKAAVQGHGLAQMELALYYESGVGVAENLKLAVEYYTKSAAQGVVKAQLRLGHCYELGKGVAKDLEIAAALYGNAAAQGDGEADACLERLSTAGGAGRA